MSAPGGQPGADGTCAEPALVFEAGRQVGAVCPYAAEHRGLTVLDSSDDWVPLLFRRDAATGETENPYRATYVALANFELGRGTEWDRARRIRSKVKKVPTRVLYVRN